MHLSGGTESCFGGGMVSRLKGIWGKAVEWKGTNHPEKRLKVNYMALFWDVDYSEGSQEYGREKTGEQIR